MTTVESSSVERTGPAPTTSPWRVLRLDWVDARRRLLYVAVDTSVVLGVALVRPRDREHPTSTPMLERLYVAPGVRGHHGPARALISRIQTEHRDIVVSERTALVSTGLPPRSLSVPCSADLSAELSTGAYGSRPTCTLGRGERGHAERTGRALLATARAVFVVQQARGVLPPQG